MSRLETYFKGMSSGRCASLWLPAVLLLALTACADRGGETIQGPGGSEVRVELLDRSVEAGKAVEVELRVVAADPAQVEVAPPQAEGLTTRLEREEREPLGELVATTRRYSLTGPPGSYVINTGQALLAQPDGTRQASPLSPLFVDIGVKGPSSELEDIESLPLSERARWPYLLGAGLLVLAVGLGFWYWRRRRRRPALVPPPEAPALIARREWAAVLMDQGLDDHRRALRLSEVFRRYIEARNELPASSWTSSEILVGLYERSGVSGPLLDAARRILDATDLLKFARRGGGLEFFLALDKDFHAYLDATEPKVTQQGAP